MGQFLGRLRHDPDGRPDVGLAAHLRPAGADRGRDRRRAPGEPRRDQRHRPDPGVGRASSAGPRGAATGASTSARRRRRSTRCSRAPASIYRQLREIAERGLAATADRSPERAGPAPGVPRRDRVRRAGGAPVIDGFLADRAGSQNARRRRGTQCRRRPAGRDHRDRDHPDREAHQDLRRRTAGSSTSTSRSPRARRSASSARTAPARRRRSGRCSTTSGRPRAGRPSSASRRPSTRSRSTAGSATCRASSRSTTS